jgi:hypothetical protein
MAPDVALQEAREQLPGILAARKIPAGPAMAALEIDGASRTDGRRRDVFFVRSHRRERIDKRDEDDWPVPAAALTPGCPIRTEDTGFFGCGVGRGIKFYGHALEVLQRELGADGLARFLRLGRSVGGDYTGDGEEWQQELTLDEALASIRVNRRS